MPNAKAPVVEGQVGGILSRPGRSWGPTDRAAIARWLWNDGLEWMLETIDGRLGEYDYLTLDVLQSFLGVGTADSSAATAPAKLRAPYDNLVDHYDPSAAGASFLAYFRRALWNHAGRAWWREIRRTCPDAAESTEANSPEGRHPAPRPPVVVSLDGTDRDDDGDGLELGGLLSGDLTKDTALPLFVRDSAAFEGMLVVLLEAVDALPPGVREVMQLRYPIDPQHGTDPPLSHREIAALLGITENNSRQRQHAGLEKLQRILVEMHPESRWLEFVKPPDDLEPLVYR